MFCSLQTDRQTDRHTHTHTHTHTTQTHTQQTHTTHSLTHSHASQVDISIYKTARTCVKTLKNIAMIMDVVQMNTPDDVEGR